jgi:hypothetical protein
MKDKDTSRVLFAWEESKGLFGFLKSLLALCGAILFQPVDFFRKIANTRDIVLKKRVTRAFIFVLILSYLKLFLDVANYYWIKYIPKEMLPGIAQVQASITPTDFLCSPFFLLRPILNFAVVLIPVFIGVKLLLGFDKPVLPAFLVLCYKSAADIFYVIPLFGSVFAAVFSLVLIVIGIKEAYCVGVLRSIFTAIVMPIVLLFSVALSLGPFLGRAVGVLYPETQVQMGKLNDLTAYMYTGAIVSAARKYKKDLGFYPVNLDVLKKYLSLEVASDVTRRRHVSGYFYSYDQIDEDHFIIEAHPIQMNYSGSRIFYSDQTGNIREGGADGPLIQDIKALESLLLARPQKIVPCGKKRFGFF